MTSEHPTLGKRIASVCLATLTALQPLASYAQGIGEAIRNADKALPHVLPVADRADMLPLPYVPPQWGAQAGATSGGSNESQKAGVANAVSMSKLVNKSKANVGDTLTWTLTADNLTATASGVLTATDTLPANVNTIVVTPGSGVTCGTAAAGAAFTCNIPTMAANTANRAVATITAKTTAEGVLTNMATLKNSANATLSCNGAVGNCTVTTLVQDDDDNILPTIIAALKPKCSAITASPTAATVNSPVTLNAACTFKGNLVKRFAFYRTAQATGLTTYLGDSVPVGTPSFVTNAPATSGVYVYAMLVLNGGIPGNAVAGVSVNVTAVAPSGCSINGPTTLTGTPAQPGNFSVACTGGSPITGYSWTRSPAVGFTTSTASGITDTPFAGATPPSATYTVVVSNSAGNATANLTVSNSSANTPPKIVSIVASSATLNINTPGVFTIQATDDKALATSSLTLNAATNTMIGATLSCTGGTTETCTVNRTPTTAGVFTLGLTLTDSQGATTTATSVVAVSVVPSAGVPALPELLPTAAVGTTAGQFAVSESGAATYSIPIQVPPGVAGLQPNLALTYNSQGGDGHVGVGWNLSGLSSITRCPKTIATDGVREPINYDAIADPSAANANDAFCLDGQRLLPVIGGLTSAPCVWPLDSSMTPNSSCRVWEFRTELENYSRILGIGDNSIGLNPGSGPTRFRVYTKSGQILEYGSRWWAMSRPRPKTAALAQLMTNGSFETPNMSDSDPSDGNGYVNPNITAQCVELCWFDLNLVADGWKFAGDSGIQRTGSAFNSTAPVGYQNAIVRNLGSVKKTVNLVAGTYTLSFLAAGRPSSPGGAQRIRIKVGSAEIMPSLLLTSSLYASYSAEFTVVAGNHVIAFEGANAGDTSAFIDDVQLVVTAVPTDTTEDATVLKIWPLDRVEDRSGNYMHIDYGGTHAPTAGEGDGTVIPSFGTAEPALSTLARVAAGARPEVELYPRRVTYGMRTGETVAANVEIARIILNYADRNAGDVQRGFDTGAGQMLLSKRLSSIVTTVGGVDDTSTKADRAAFHASEKVKSGLDPCEGTAYDGTNTACGKSTRRYTLGYVSSPSSSRSRLTSVVECGWDGVCLPATNLAWQEEASATLSGTGSGSQAANVPADGNVNWNFLLRQGRVADVVGDGRSRIVRRRDAGNGNALQVCTHNGTKFTCEDWQLPAGREIPDAGSANTWNLADVTGDGIADLVVTVQKPNNVYVAYACPLPGNPQTGIALCIDIPGASAVAPNTSALAGRFYAKTGDFNGDGRIDVAFYRGNGYFEICLSAGTTVSPAWNCRPPTRIQGLGIAFANVSSELNHLIVADFNGDGRADIAYRVANACIGATPAGDQCLIEPTENDSYWAVCFSAGPDNALILDCATRYGVGISGAVQAVSGKISKLVTFDFNGDGLADMGTLVPGQGWRVCLATGDGEFKRESNGQCPIWSGPEGSAETTVAGDFNGDGRTDLAYYNGNQWQICLSTGNGFQYPCALVSSLATAPAIDGTSAEIFPGDYNGDGKTDIVVNALSPAGTLSYGFASSTMPDLMTAVTTGLGATTAVKYVSLAKSGGVYQKTLAADAAPVLDSEIIIQSPMYVVASTLASTTLADKFFKTEYFYESLRADKYGRGLYGFNRRSVVDNLVADANGVVTDDTSKVTTAYRANQIWPNAGRPLRVIKTAANSQIISDATIEYGARCRNAASAIVACPATPWTPGYRWEGLQAKSTQVSNDLNGQALPTTTTFTGVDPSSGLQALDSFYDAFGNPLKVTTRTVNGVETWQQDVTNTYHPAVTNQWLLGKLATATTTSTVSGYTTNGAASVTRKSSFTYQGIAAGACTGAAPGQLCTETVEPDRAIAGTYSLYQQSAYTYDAFGNRLSSSASFYNDDAGTGGPQARSSNTTYQYGKYPLVNTRAYTGNAALDLSDTRQYSDTRCRMPTKVTDANGNYATMAYDGFCRKVAEAAYTNDGKLVKWTTFVLDATGLTAGESYRMVTSTSEGGQSTAFYDNLQRTVRAQSRTFSGTFAEASTVYDALGRKSSMTQPVSSGTSTGTATTQYAYDALNRVTKETLPDDPSTTGTSIVRTEYNGLSTTVIRSNINASSTAVGTSASAHATKKTANAKGLVAKVETGYRTNVTDPATTTFLTTINYAYDAIGNLTQVASPGANSGTLTKTMSYDLRGRQTQLTDPDAGTYTYAYNGAGEQRTQNDLRGFVTTTNYDPFGRKTIRTETQAAGGDATTTWSYDCANGKGLLCSVSYSGTAGSGNATRKTTTYDQYSRPVATRTVIAGQTFVSQVAYDGRGRPLYSVYPQATLAAAPLSLKQSYNSYGFATQTEHATTGFVYSSITSRNNDGQVNGATMGSGLLTQSNGYSGDGLGRLASINITGGTTLTQNFGFESVGNLKSRSLTGGGRTEVESFTYDALDRLLSSGAGAGNVTALPDTGSFGYDSAGNLNSKAGLTLGYAPASTTSNNRLCGIAVVNASTCLGGTGAVSYDSNGNILAYIRPTAAQSGNAPGADGATVALSGYTAFNLPTSISKSLAGTVQASAEFFYDAGYQRVRQVKRSGAVQTGPFVDDILYVVPGGFELHRNAAGQVTSSIATVSGPDGVVATVSTQFDPNTGLPVTQASVTNLSGTTTVTKLLLKDHLGSMVAEFTVTASNAGTLVVHGFGPRGNARNGLNGDQRGFTGHEHLAELGIIHMNGRLYDAVLGRLLQADPIIQAPHNAQSHNRYSYVLNNPLSFTDPSGFSAWTRFRAPILAIAAAITMQYYLMPYLLGASSFAAMTGTQQFFTVVASGFASGGISGGNIQSALQGAFTAGLTFGLASEFGLHGGADFLSGKHFGQIALHAAMGCGSSAAAGGSCKSGAIAGGTSAFASPLLPGDGKSFSAGRLVGSAIIGAVASRLSGGKAENGALTAAFSYLFNECGHGMCGYNKNDAAAGNGYNGVSNGYTGHFIYDPALEGVHPEYLLGGGLAAFATTRAVLRTAYGAELEAAGLIAGARRTWDNLSFDGPGAGLAHANGRIFGVRWKNSEWGVRLDLHPMKGDPTNTPVLHINFGPLGRGEAAHIPIFDPKWFGWTR